MKKIFTLGYCLLTIVAVAQTKLVNPILSGFYPDPSICKSGNDYYLVNSTFAYFPGIPVFTSKDLKNWKQIGNVIDRPTQMDFIGDGVSRGLFAPAIRYHEGIYYVTCTDIDQNGNFIATATNPAGPWSDPVWIREVEGIDPSLFIDHDKSYIIYNSYSPDNKPLYDGHRTVRIVEFDLKTLKVIGKEIILVNGGVDLSKKPVWIEGPHIFRKDEWYYLICAEGGTAINHSEVVFRSKNATGPYVPYQKNPILTQKHLDPNRKNPITSAGHADFVTGPDGNDYAVFIATRPYEGDYYNTGRETFIAPVKWMDGWPVINPDFEEIQYTYNTSIKENKLAHTIPQSGNFSYRLSFEKSIDPSLLFLRSHDTSWYNLSKENGLTMKLLPETCMEDGHPAFLGKRQQHLICTAETILKFTPKVENEKAGLLIFQSEYSFYFICKSIKNGKTIIQLFTGNKNTQTMDLINELPLAAGSDELGLRIKANNDKYSFYFSNGTQWKALKENANGKILSTKEAGGFVGSLFALYATSSDLPSENKASFRWIDYSGQDIIHK